MITKLYIIRHAEAEGNLYRRVQGHYDSPVTELGLKQIQALGERFNGLKIDAVYSSDLVRAQSTARALAIPRGLEIYTTPALREVNMGHWEDMTWARLERTEGKQLAFFSSDPVRWDNGTNESFTALTTRMGKALAEIATAHPGQTVCIVTHGNSIRTLLARLHSLPSERFSEIPHCDNTAVSLLEVSPTTGLTVRWMNDASHLDETLSTFARQSWWRTPSGGDKGNLDFVSLDLDDPESPNRYLFYRQEAWGEVHGSLAGFTDEYVALAAMHAAAHSLALVEVITSDGTPIGLVELDVLRGEEHGEGHISFFYIAPEYRGHHFGPQLIGHATSVYRSLGRRKLSLHVAEVNEKAIGFYERFGFKKVGETEGVRGPLWVMEKDITVRVR
ncbi:MAG: bifunctional histidine phosphatase family protein/GNAT family N-acetyltransferase [Oscillospiraceae bacterium]|nr:bifunctional histidine phosphatase family protein/GNAT family N-acetyltransferase [Oscillospiraceae bacterium]